jgi:tetratricopeptide (TPR) repeat protein
MTIFKTIAFLAAVAAPTTSLTGVVNASTELPSLSGAYLAGRTAGRLRDVEAAAVYVEKALDLDPGNAIMTERLFQFRLSEGNIAAAEVLAIKVIKVNSQQRMARVVLGLKDMRDGHFSDARDNFTEAAYTPIGELTAAMLRAWSFAGDGNLNSALKELSKLDANESFANFKALHEALITDFMNNDVRADAAYKKAYAQAGSSLRVTQAYGNYLERKARVDEAKKVYEDFLASGNGNVLISRQLDGLKAGTKPSGKFVSSVLAGAGEALFSIAAAMNDQESADVALLYANLALANAADKSVMVTLVGDINSDLERYTAAIAAYEQVPSDSPLRPSATIQVALNLQRDDKSADAQTKLRDLLAGDPKDVDAWSTLGNIYRNNEDYSKAADAYGKAIDLTVAKGKPEWQLYYYRGISRERLKDWPNAEADLNAALKLSPEESSVLNYLGYSLIDRKERLDAAIAMVKKAVELKPNDGYIVDSLGWAYYQLGNYDEAVPQLERAVDLKAGDAIIAEHLGDVYWRVGRKLEAKFQWQHAKDNNPEPDDLKRIQDKLNNGMTDLPASSEKTKPSNG